MVAEVALGVSAGANVSAALVDSPSDLVRGAIGGAFIIGIAFLAGSAVFRRSSASVCALLMVLAAATLEFTWLGLFTLPSPKMMVMLQGVFAASVLIYLSSTVQAAKRNPLLGGLMFAGALTFVGLGAINFLGRTTDASGMMQTGLFGLGVFAVVLTVFQSLRGDHGARLLLPGAVIAIAAPLVGDLYGREALSLTPHALFTFGILTASLVALTESGISAMAQAGFVEPQPAMMHANAEPTAEEKMRVSENQLAQVLDYSGVAVWDWSLHEDHQTESFAALVDADPVIKMSPNRMRELVDSKDRALFESDVYGRNKGDGSFDVVLKLQNKQSVRLRGARAVDGNGELERLVVFAEKSNDKSAGSKSLWDAAKPAAIASAAAAAKPENAFAKKAKNLPTTETLSADIGIALEKGYLEAAFQPIVSLDDQSVMGFEALLRPTGDATGFDNLTTEEIVTAAEVQGRGGALASMMLKSSVDFLADKIKDRKQKNIFVAMNVSFAQLRSGGFVDAVTKEIKDNNLPDKSLVLELTESEAVTDEVAAQSIFGKLKKSGAALAFDDFGVGFSSLSNLHKFSFDYLKVDKSFVEKISEDKDVAKIVAALAQLGGDLGMTVIAEGLATKSLAEAAKKSGCTLGQGYAFGQAVPLPKKAAAKLKKDAKAGKTTEVVEQSLTVDADDKELKASPTETETPEKKPSRRRFWSNELR